MHRSISVVLHIATYEVDNVTDVVLGHAVLSV